MTSIISSASLIKKVYVPKYLFVLSRVVSSFINLMAAFTALLLVMMATRIELHWTAFLAFIPLFMVVGFSLGVGLILAALTVKFRDIMHLYSVFTTGLMYLTPIIYPMNILPERIKQVVMLNPLTNYLIMFRNLMLDNTLPSWSSILVGIAEMVIVLILGVYVFYKKQDEFILNI
jgi:ABC-type polysaccharide/polyol phosphate export permease